MKRLLKKMSALFLAFSLTLPVQASVMEDGRKVFDAEWVQIESEGQLEWQDDGSYEYLLSGGRYYLGFWTTGVIDPYRIIDYLEYEREEGEKHKIDYQFLGKFNFNKDQAEIQLDYTENGQKYHCQMYVANDTIYCNRDYYVQKYSENASQLMEKEYIAFPLYEWDVVEELLSVDGYFYDDDIEVYQKCFEIELPIKEEGHCYTLELADEKMGDFVQTQLNKIINNREQVIKRVNEYMDYELSEEDKADIEKVVAYIERVQILKRLGYFINGLCYGTDMKVVMDFNKEQQMDFTMEGKLAYMKGQYLSGQMKAKITPLSSYKIVIPKDVQTIGSMDEYVYDYNMRYFPYCDDRKEYEEMLADTTDIAVDEGELAEELMSYYLVNAALMEGEKNYIVPMMLNDNTAVIFRFDQEKEQFYVVNEEDYYNEGGNVDKSKCTYLPTECICKGKLYMINVEEIKQFGLEYSIEEDEDGMKYIEVYQTYE